MGEYHLCCRSPSGVTLDEIAQFFGQVRFNTARDHCLLMHPFWLTYAPIFPNISISVSSGRSKNRRRTTTWASQRSTCTKIRQPAGPRAMLPCSRSRTLKPHSPQLSGTMAMLSIIVGTKLSVGIAHTMSKGGGRAAAKGAAKVVARAAGAGSPALAAHMAPVCGKWHNAETAKSKYYRGVIFWEEGDTKTPRNVVSLATARVRDGC